MRKITEIQTQEIIQLYLNGLGSDSIGKQFDVTPTCILKILKKNNIERRDFARKLNDDQIKEIIELYQNGSSANDIAKIYDVSHSAILKKLKKNNIVRRNADDTHRIYQINEIFFDNIDTEEKAYFLGILYADGCNLQDSNAVRIELKESDKDILYKLSKLIYVENPDDHVKFYTRKTGKSAGKTYGYLTIHSKYMCQKLYDVGCTPRKSLTLQWPESIIDPELQRHFIRGYFDGDGGFSLTEIKTRGAHLKIISTLEFCTKIKEIIEKEIDCHFNIYHDIKDKNVYTINSGGNRHVRNILNWLYKNSNIRLNRKFELYLKLLEQIRNTDLLIAAGTRGYSKRYLNT